jgi:hypothetical protein
LWCAISNVPCDDLCEIPWFQPPGPGHLHFPFISFSSPPIKYHAQLIYVPIDFNPPDSCPLSILSCRSTMSFPSKRKSLLLGQGLCRGTHPLPSVLLCQDPVIDDATKHGNGDVASMPRLWTSDLVVFSVVPSYITTGARHCWLRQYSIKLGSQFLR